MRNISCSVFDVDCCGITRHSGQLLPFVSNSLLEGPTRELVALVRGHGMRWNSIPYICQWNIMSICSVLFPLSSS